MVTYAIKNHILSKIKDSPISAVDLFCGVGGLTHGLLKAGISVTAGIDIDDKAQYAYETNNPNSTYINRDITDITGQDVHDLFDNERYTLLAGCAPCTPFSKLTNGMDGHHAFDLLNHFSRLVKKVEPDLVMMENVPELASRGSTVFARFTDTLDRHGYWLNYAVVRCEEYGVPQKRRRLVLLASRHGEISIPDGPYHYPSTWKTVRKTISHLKCLRSGEADPNDPLHSASQLSDANLERIQHTTHDGGTWADWPSRLVLPCHRKHSGRTYSSIYGRMWWDRPAPTMTTLCTGLGNGRYGHPDQDRAITLREAALFQSFPNSYCFWPIDKTLIRNAVSRMIGNAVPPALARRLGLAFVEHVQNL